MRFELSCIIEAPREEVFAFLEAAEARPRERWSLIPGVEPPPAPTGGGLWLPFPTPIETELLDHRPPELLAYRWTSKRSLRGEVEYLLQPAGEDTRLEQRTSLEVHGALSALESVVRRALHKAAERRIHRIRACLVGHGHVHEPKRLSWPPEPEPAWALEARKQVRS